MAESGIWQKACFVRAVIYLNCLLAVFAAAQEKSGSKYVGPGSCSASACHGGVQPLASTRVLQNEYSTWVVKDSHFRAYRSLQSPVSQRMGKILGIGNPAASPKCLACHALAVSPEQKGRDFDVSEGVSCESCHGPASAWLGPHTLKGWSTQKSVALGMYDITEVAHRSEKCLTCHLGTPEKEVDHKMIAAGHPDLVFELDSYSAIEPPHWKPPADPNYGVRLWAVGQAIQLREALKRLARRTQSPNWPEFSEYDCFSCHHSLTKPESSWRQERGYENRGAGAPVWNSAHYTILRILAKDIDSTASQQLETELQSVYQVTSNLSSSPKNIGDSAQRASELAASLVTKINQASFDKARASRLLEEISAQADSISNQDTRSAEQAAMALDSLFICYEKQGSAHPAVRAAIDGLFQELDNPSAYNAPRFSAQMRKVNAALHEAGITQ
ncbi:MAG TPA: multiheme c-type cytochrome [Candidatus Angelobacter sp.]|nr:multiheme c-type cytochrome [Candidatus Angelobacter sp.]